METFRIRREIVSKVLEVPEDTILQGQDVTWLVIAAGKLSRNGIPGQAKLLWGRMDEHKYLFLFWLALEGFQFSEVLKDKLTHPQTGETLTPRVLFMSMIQAHVEELQREFSPAVIGGGRFTAQGEMTSWRTKFFEKDTPRSDPDWEKLIFARLNHAVEETLESSGPFRPSPIAKAG